MNMKSNALAAICLAAVVAPACAQEEDDGDIADDGDITQVYYVEVKPGHNEQFNAGWADYWACYRENGGQWFWAAWNPVSGKLGGVLFRSPGHNWADFDADDPAGEACGEVFQTSLLPHFGDVYSGFRSALDDVSRIPDGPINLVWVYDIDVSDTGAAMEVIGAWHEAFEAADEGAYAWVNWVTSSEGWDLSVVILNENFAGMEPDGPDFNEIQTNHHGEEKAAELLAKWQEVVTHSRSRMLRRNQDLSYSPEAE